MTVHNWIQSLEMGKTYKLPSNCTVSDIAEYAYARFGYNIAKVSKTEIKRYCVHCGR